MDLLRNLATGDPLRFLPTFLHCLRSDPSYALSVLLYLRKPDNLINTHSKNICRFLLFVTSITNNDEYVRFLPTYFGCWGDALHIYRYKIIHGKSQSFEELSLLANAIRNGDILAAKWAPSEKSMWNDEPLSAAQKLMDLLSLGPKEYRKLLANLRHNLLETQMSQHRFDEIHLGDIPHTAFSRYRNALARNSNSLGQISHERMALRNRFLEFSGAKEPSAKEPSAICVLDNYVTNAKAYEFVSQVSWSQVGHWHRKIINMGEFPGIVQLPGDLSPNGGDLAGYVGDMLFGGGVLRLARIYELILGQCLIYSVGPPKYIYVIADIPLRNPCELDTSLYEKHGIGVPHTIYINVGRPGRYPKYTKHITEIGDLGELHLAMAIGEIGPPPPLGTTDSVSIPTGGEDLVKIFYY